MTGGWGGFRRGDIDEGPPPSNDPERPPRGPASGSLANPQRVQSSTNIVIINGPVQHCPADCPCHIEENRD